MDCAKLQERECHIRPEEQEAILEAIDGCREIKQHCNHYRRLLENAEKHRASVRPAVYERVAGEYASKLAELQARLDRDQEELAERVQRCVQKQESLRQAGQQAADRLEEIEFRVKVGEFSEEEVAEELKRLRATVAENNETAARLKEILDRCRQLGLDMGEIFSKPVIEAAEPESGAAAETAQTRVSDDQVPQDAPAASSEVEKAPQAGQEPFVADSPAASLWAPEADTSPALPEPPETTESFVLEPQEAPAASEDCPVVQCPEALPSQNDSAPASCQAGREGGAGFVSGYLCALDGSRKGTRFPLISSDITLGKSPGIDIRLQDAGIANFHARIVYKNRKYYLENLDPMGRSFVNGIQADVLELKDGDLIRLGEIKMRVEFASHSGEAAAAQAA